MQSTVEIRSKILDKLRVKYPDFIWTEGEPLVDILDSVAEMHFKREFIIELTESLHTIAGFRRLIFDQTFRQLVSQTLGLSLQKRTMVSVGVPSEVENDVDAFVWYYLDRYAEKYGYSRKAGTTAYGLMKIKSAVSGQVKIIFINGIKLYTVVSDITATAENTVVVKSMGYGQEYNLSPNSLQIDSITGATTDITDITFTHDQITNGNNYQSSEDFLVKLETNMSIARGLGSKNNIATIVSGIDGVDKFKILQTEIGSRFKGSMDIVIKGSATRLQEYTTVIAHDSRVLIPYQPASLNTILDSSDSIIPDIFYDLEYETMEHSNKDAIYVNFSNKIGSPLVVGDIVKLQLLIDSVCMDTDSALNQFFSDKYELARDFRIFQAQPHRIDIEMTVKLKTATKNEDAISAVKNKLQDFFNGLDIQEKLDATDIINSMYDIYLSGNSLVDAIDMLKIHKKDKSGILEETIENVGTLYPDDREFWNLQIMTITLVI